LSEVSQILGDRFTFLTLKDIDFLDEIPEPYDTLEENSIIKAKTVFDQKGYNTFAEDTGLFVEGLNNEPGVYSARYAGEDGNAERNMAKVMTRLGSETNRKAYFKTVVTLILNGEVKQFSGVCLGKIALTQSGTQGFGYDPIFIPDGSELSFADLSASQKNEFSHRRKAFDAFAAFLISNP
jgi:XTP/dITP diphosphohydrolase